MVSVRCHGIWDKFSLMVLDFQDLRNLCCSWEDFLSDGSFRGGKRDSKVLALAIMPLNISFGNSGSSAFL